MSAIEYARAWMAKNCEELKAQNPNEYNRTLGLIVDFVTDFQEFLAGAKGNPMTPGTTTAPAVDQQRLVRQLSVEIWECRACGKDAPCRVEITHQPTKYPHVEAQPRFTSRNRGCLCDERLDPAWIRLPNKDVSR